MAADFEKYEIEKGAFMCFVCVDVASSRTKSEEVPRRNAETRKICGCLTRKRYEIRRT